MATTNVQVLTLERLEKRTVVDNLVGGSCVLLEQVV